MKYTLFLFALFTNSYLGITQSATKNSSTSDSQETIVNKDNSEKQQTNIPHKDILKFKDLGVVTYNDFGAIGNGKDDDMTAIVATHEFANEHNLKVQADDESTYYIGGQQKTAIVRTDTNFGKAKFIIDDTEVQNRRSSIFEISSNHVPYKLEGISTLKRNQKKIDVALTGDCLITATDDNVKHYIRLGLNQDNGASQTDIFVVDAEGNVDMDAPIIWDFDQITEIYALPIDEDTLTITGGHFTTIANRDSSKYNYYSRNMEIRRSNVIVDGLEHHITGEGEQGAPYRGFISIRDCANITVMNSILTGHKTYTTIGSAEKPVKMGSYDISISRALNISFISCSQTNDIDDKNYWGIMGSNYSKNLLLDQCTFSRFDAHKGVANATIRNSTLGHMGINAIGSGTFMVENTTIRGKRLINLRSDYGSTWQGEFIIRNCIFKPTGDSIVSPSLINGNHTGLHDFGYKCYMPEKITIENLFIDDSIHEIEYKGPFIFEDFNPDVADSTQVQPFPHVKTKVVTLNNVTTASGLELRVCENLLMFNDVEIIKK